MVKQIGAHYLERLPATTTQPAREVLYRVIGHQKTRMGHELGEASVLAKVAEINSTPSERERFTYWGCWLSIGEARMFMDRVESA